MSYSASRYCDGIVRWSIELCPKVGDGVREPHIMAADGRLDFRRERDMPYG